MISTTSVPVRSLTTILSAPPKALKSMPSTSLRSMVTLAISRKNRTRPLLAEMSICSATTGAIEEHRVEAVLALERVVVVAGVPDKGVVAGAHQGRVVAITAVDQVVAFAAENEVISEAAVHRELDAVGFQRSGVHDVETVQGVEDQTVVGQLLEDDVDRGLKAEDV